MCPCTGRGGSRVMPGVLSSCFSTRHRRRNHRLQRLSLTKPHRKLTCVHPSDLPFARFAWMVQAPLGLHPFAVACFVTWHLQGSGTGLDIGWSMTTSHAHSSWCNIASRPPLRTVHATFTAYGSSMGQRALAARGRPIGFGVDLDVTTAVPATELPAVVGAAPATAVTAAPTFLLCPLRRLADGSRPPTPEGSLPACAWGDVATPIQPITDRPSLAPSSFTRCPIRSSYDFLCCPRAAGQRAYHVPQVEPYGWFRSRLSAGGTPSAPGKFGIPGPDHMPFGPSLISQPPRGGHDYRRSATASLACPM